MTPPQPPLLTTPDYPGHDHGSPTGSYHLHAPHLSARITPGTDIAALILATCAPQPGDIIAVSSKIISKAEGRLVTLTGDAAARRAQREALIDAQTVRTLATIRSTRIVETTLGITQAGAGIDASNTDPDTLVLLPTDPDGTAERLRAAVEATLPAAAPHGVGILLTDSVSRAWRRGQIDIAIGLAGIAPTHGYHGAQDAYGNDLTLTEMAIADELACAANLASGKLSGRPLTRIRGLAHLVAAPGVPTPGARGINRTGEEDLFYLGTAEALARGAAGKGPEHASGA